MDIVSTLVTPALAAIVSIGSLIFAYHRNNETEANSLIGLLKDKLALVDRDVTSLQAKLAAVERRLDDCETARANLAGENTRIMRLLLVPPYDGHNEERKHD